MTTTATDTVNGWDIHRTVNGDPRSTATHLYELVPHGVDPYGDDDVLELFHLESSADLSTARSIARRATPSAYFTERARAEALNSLAIAQWAHELTTP